MGKQKEKDNYQDAAEIREYDKGKRAGEQHRRGGKPGSGKRGSHSRRGGSGSKGGFKKFEPRPVPIDTGAKTDNDPQWYTISDQILKDVASLTVSIQNGLPVKREYAYPPQFSPSNNNKAVSEYETMPGIVTLEFVPTFGRDSGPTSPLNMASNSLYSFTMKDQLGSVKASAGDFSMYTLAMDSAYYMYSWACRLYGILNNGFSATDMYTPIALLKAQGVDYEDLKRHMPELRSIINNAAFNLQAMKVPSGLTYNTRHIWMCQHVYTDSPSVRAQYYLYTPLGFYIYNEANLSADNPKLHASNLQWRKLSYYARTNNLITVASIAEIFNDIISPIWGSNDCKRMSSQVYRAFGNTVVPVNPISEAYQVAPAYSKEVLSQIENTYIWSDTFGEYDPSAPPDMQQLVESSLWQHVTDLNAGEYLRTETYITRKIRVHKTTDSQGTLDVLSIPLTKRNIILNYHEDQVGIPQVVVSTRLAYSPVELAAAELTQNGDSMTCWYKLKLLSPGSEIIARAALTYLDVQYYPDGLEVKQVAPPVIEKQYFASDMYFDESDISYEKTAKLIKLQTILEKFDWHPIFGTAQCIPIQHTGDIAGYKLVLPKYAYDLDTIINTQTEYIGNINNAALLKQFQPDGMAGYTIKA